MCPASASPSRGSALLVPGYRGSVRQPILTRIAARLADVGIATDAIALSTSPRPSAEYRRELAALRAARDELRRRHPGPLALVGRSFGGRMCVFVAAEEPPDAPVVVGHPIAPPGRARPRDETALAAVRCPTLIVQGDADELGPLAAIERIASANPLIDLVTIAGAGHELGAHEDEAATHVARWLATVFA